MLFLGSRLQPGFSTKGFIQILPPNTAVPLPIQGVLESIQTSLTRKYVYAGGVVIAELDNNNNLVKEYVRGLSLGGGIGGILYRKEGSSFYYNHYDGSGNVTSVTDGNKEEVAIYEYDAFGNVLTEAGSLANEFKFSTKQADKRGRLIDFGFRWYDPEIGRWTQRDPLGAAGGLNLYAYCSGNPVNLIDLWGFEWADLASSAVPRTCVYGTRGFSEGLFGNQGSTGTRTAGGAASGFASGATQGVGRSIGGALGGVLGRGAGDMFAYFIDAAATGDDWRWTPDPDDPWDSGGTGSALESGVSGLAKGLVMCIPGGAAGLAFGGTAGGIIVESLKGLWEAAISELTKRDEQWDMCIRRGDRRNSRGPCPENAPIPPDNRVSGRHDMLGGMGVSTDF